MRDVYLDKIVDITDENCEFIKEFNHEIRKYGALVYNQDYNSYQFIKEFEQIDYKKDVLPDFIKVESGLPLLKALKVTVHYEFDPENEEDEENLEIWSQLKETELPVFDYDEDGEVYEKSFVKLDTKNTTHIIWFLSKESYDYIIGTDLLMYVPIIKDVNIARELIKKYGVYPCDENYDEADLNAYVKPVLKGIYETGEEKK